MPINLSIYDTGELNRVLYDEKTLGTPETFWLTEFFRNEITFDDDYVDFDRVGSTRRMAPLVVPTAQGRPVVSRAEKVTRLRPAYLKPKDAVDPNRLIRKTVGIGELGGDPSQAMSPTQRMAAVVAAILQEHRHSIIRRWEWMAAQATIYGQVTLEGPDYPKTVVDFQRDPSLTVTLTGSDTWNSGTANILASITQLRKLMRNVPFGGKANVMIIGTDVANVMLDDQRVQEQLDRTLRIEQEPSLKTGVRNADDYEYIGNIATGLPVYVCSATYEDDDGTTKDFLDPKDVVLVGDIQGHRLFGAIRDVDMLRPVPMWTKSWKQEDPSERFIMTQSAPLMAPINPNRSLRARVQS